MKRAERRRAVRYLRQPYIERLNRAIADGALLTLPGVVIEVAVAHDDWCSKLRGGACACDPDITAEYRHQEVSGPGGGPVVMSLAELARRLADEERRAALRGSGTAW